MTKQYKLLQTVKIGQFPRQPRLDKLFTRTGSVATKRIYSRYETLFTTPLCQCNTDIFVLPTPNLSLRRFYPIVLVKMLLDSIRQLPEQSSFGHDLNSDLTKMWEILDQSPSAPASIQGGPDDSILNPEAPNWRFQFRFYCTGHITQCYLHKGSGIS